MNSGGDCTCVQCRQTFTSLELFDRHQDVDYTRPHSQMVLCKPPQSLGLSQGPGGTWGTPEGLKTRERRVRLLARATQARRTR